MAQQKFWLVIPTAATIEAARGKITVDVVFEGVSGEAAAKSAAVRSAIASGTTMLVAEAVFEASPVVADATITAQLTPTDEV